MEIWLNWSYVGAGVLVLWLAWYNGANDVAKGIATLVGGGETGATRAVWWGCLWTVLGGLAALAWGLALVDMFSHGLLAPGFSADLAYIVSVLFGAGAWVMAATRLGLPVSTTHALLGAVVGAALVAVGPDSLRYSALAANAALPLLLGPLLALALCWLLLLAARWIAARVPPWRPGCCARADWQRDPFVCAEGEAPGRTRRMLGLLHWLSSGATSFARALNDVPKIAAFLVLALGLAPGLVPTPTTFALLAVTAVMGLGSLWGGYRVLRVLAHRVAPLDRRNGVFANVTTAGLVLLAAPLGLPLSTTHVSVGSMLGVRLGEGHAPRERDAIRAIVGGWLVTLPVTAALAAAGGWLLRGAGLA